MAVQLKNKRVVFMTGLAFIIMFIFYKTLSKVPKQRTVPLQPGISDIYASAETGRQKAGLSGRALTDLRSIFHLAGEIKANGDVILITMVNQAFLPFAFSWLCNTKNMNVHKQVLLVATDKESYKQLREKWPKVRTAFWQLDDSLKGGLKYSHAGYVRYMMLRTDMLKELIVNKHEILLFEVDCLWMRNPLPSFLADRKRYDLIGTEIGTQKEMAGGFIYFQPTKITIEEWEKLTKALEKATEEMKRLPNDKYVSEGINDQVFLQKILKRRGVQYKMFHGDKYPDGKWYSLSEADRRKTRPYLINNNWVVGNEAKITRAKKWGHWFIKSDNSCDESAIKKVVK